MTNLNNKLQDFPNDEINLANIKSSLIREKKIDWLYSIHINIIVNNICLYN